MYEHDLEREGKPVDIKNIEEWSHNEASHEKFKIFLEKLQDKKPTDL